MSFDVICANKILAKISEFTVNSTNMALRSERKLLRVFCVCFFSGDLVSWNMMGLSSISESLHTKYDSY